jgi:hypothetical protein
MKSMAEHNLGVKVASLTSQLEMARSVIDTYRVLAKNQSTEIKELKTAINNLENDLLQAEIDKHSVWA